MVKFIGGLLIVTACTALGMEKSRELSLHRTELEELQKIFTYIQKELEYMRTPIDELFQKLQKKFPGAYQRWLEEIANSKEVLGKKSFEEIWLSSIDIYLKGSLLTKSEIEELKQIGKHLSRPEAMSLFLIQIENAIQVTREEEKEKKKLYQSMGILAGIFLVLVLI